MSSSLKPLNQKAWLLVLPVIVCVAFSAVLPLMTVVNYSVQDIISPERRVFVGTEWFKAGAPWIIVSVVLFVITGILYGAGLEPIQKKLLRLVDAMPHGGPLPPEYEGLMAKWFRLGGIATLLPLVVFFLMVFKPAF